MKPNNTKHKFIELRAAGYSFDKIAKQLKVCKQTCITWSKELLTEIENLKQIELEALQEKFLLLKNQRIERIGKILNKLDTQLDNLDGLTVEQAIKLYIKLMEAAASEHGSLNFKGLEEQLDFSNYDKIASSWRP